MSELKARLADDRAMRDAALDVFSADLRFVREDMKARSVGKRITDRIGESAMEMVDEAVDYAEANRGRVAAAAAAAVLWFARAPLLHGLARLAGHDKGGKEQDDGDSRSCDE
jgi:hypothetical protein